LANLHFSTLLVFALVCTAVFFLHFIVSLFLGDGHDDAVSAELESLESMAGGFSIFSLFTLSGLLSGISIALWTYLLFDDASYRAMLIALAAGVATFVVYGGLRKWIRQLDRPGVPEALIVERGDEGVVYIRIHANGQKGGQAYFDKHHQRRTFDAITEEDQPIPSSTRVTVVDVIGEASDNPIIKVKTHS